MTDIFLFTRYFISSNKSNDFLQHKVLFPFYPEYSLSLHSDPRAASLVRWYSERCETSVKYERWNAWEVRERFPAYKIFYDEKQVALIQKMSFKLKKIRRNNKVRRWRLWFEKFSLLCLQPQSLQNSTCSKLTILKSCKLKCRVLTRNSAISEDFFDFQPRSTTTLIVSLTERISLRMVKGHLSAPRRWSETVI